MSGPAFHETSVYAVYQYLAVGGNWFVRTPLDISDGQHAYYECMNIARTLVVYVESDEDVQYKFDMSTSDTIDENDMRLQKNALHVLRIPLSLGKRPIVHFKQVRSAAVGKIRLIER